MLLELLLGQLAGPDTAYEAQDRCEEEGSTASLVVQAEGVWPRPAAEALAPLVLQCLQMRANKRPPDVGAVATQLEVVRDLLAQTEAAALKVSG